MEQILDFNKIHILREKLALHGHDIGVPDAAKTIDDLLLVVETQANDLRLAAVLEERNRKGWEAPW